MSFDVQDPTAWMPFLSAEAVEQYGPVECWCTHFIVGDVVVIAVAFALHVAIAIAVVVKRNG